MEQVILHSQFFIRRSSCFRIGATVM